MSTNLMDSIASKMESEPIEIPEALNSREKKIMFLSNLGIISNFFCKVAYLFMSQSLSF